MPSVPSGVPSNDNLPQGIDRADGLNGRIGQATTGLTVQSNGSAGTSTDIIPINETPDSPVLERAEQCTVRHTYTGSPTEMLNRWMVYPRGTLVKDSASNYYRILSTTYSTMKGDVARLDITSEAVSFDNPPDEFSVVPVNLGLDILKHPRYFYALMPTNQIPGFSGTVDTDPEIAIKQMIIRGIQAYRENPFIPTNNTINDISGALHNSIGVMFSSGEGQYAVPNPNFNRSFRVFTPSNDVLTSPPAAAVNDGDYNPMFYYVSFDSTNSSSVQLALAAARELLGKLWRLEDTPMVNGIEITWSEYFWRPPPLDLGGYIQDPITGAGTPTNALSTSTPYNKRTLIPDYFYSYTNPPNSNYTIFDYLAQYNPQCYSSDGTGNAGTTKISWLRCADSIEFQRTWFKVTHKWMGAPIGAWDADIYGTGQRPLIPSYYRELTFG